MPDLVSNYVTTDSTGKISATFAGRIQAQGMDLPSQHISGFSSGAPTPANQIIWRNGGDGSQVADVYASDTLTDTFGHINQASFRSHWPGLAPDAGTESLAALIASSRNNSADVIAQARLGAGTLQQALILASDGSSDFVTAANVVPFYSGGNSFTSVAFGRKVTTGVKGIIAASGYASTSAGNKTWQVLLNGTLISQPTFSFNLTSVHTFMLTAVNFPITLNANTSYTIALNYIGDLVFDIYDVFLGCLIGF